MRWIERNRNPGAGDSQRSSWGGVPWVQTPLPSPHIHSQMSLPPRPQQARGRVCKAGHTFVSLVARYPLSWPGSRTQMPPAKRDHQVEEREQLWLAAGPTVTGRSRGAGPWREKCHLPVAAFLLPSLLGNAGFQESCTGTSSLQPTQP